MKKLKGFNFHIFKKQWFDYFIQRMLLPIISQPEKKKDKELLIKKKEKRGEKGKEKEKKEMLAGFCDYLSEQLYSSLYKSAATDAAAKLTKTCGAL